MITIVSVKDEESKTLKLKLSLLHLKLEFMTTKTCIRWRTKVHKNHVNDSSFVFIWSSLVSSIYNYYAYLIAITINRFWTFFSWLLRLDSSCNWDFVVQMVKKTLESTQLNSKIENISKNFKECYKWCNFNAL